jgi:hypothetical protein
LIVRIVLSLVAAGLVATTAPACSHGNEARETRAAASTPRTTEAPRTVCAMVTAAEMSAIVGTTVTAGSGEDGSSATCRYNPAERSTPSIEITVDWGGGRAAMSAAGILSRHEAGMVDPLAGLGDEASAIGPVLWVRLGGDLVNLTLWGVDDSVVVAKRIVNTMRPRMGPSSQPIAADAPGSGDTSAGIPKEAQEIATPPRVDEPTFRSAAGLPRRTVPLVKGLTMVLARHEPRRGDWEAIGTIDDVTAQELSMTYRANPPDDGPLVIARVVRRSDLRESHRIHGRFTPGDPVEFSGSTAFSFSSAVLTELRTRGERLFER